MISFLKARPTEVWLGLWVAIVSALEGFGVHMDPKAAAGVGSAIAWAVTILANRAPNWGPLPPPP